MASLLCGNTSSGTRKPCTGKDNHDRLMALFHTGTDVKRHLLQHYLSQKNLYLADYLFGRYQFLPPDDIKRALRTKNIQLSDLGIYAIDTLLTDQCFDLFWDSCLDSLETILNRNKELLYSLYKTSGRANKESAKNARKWEFLSKNQWEYLYQGPDMEDIKLNDVRPQKGLAIQSFDDDINYVLLSNVCPLYQSLQVVTTNQIKLSRIAVENEVQTETVDEIWKLMETHLKPISRYCFCETHFDHKLNWIKNGTFKYIKAQENRKLILESTFDNKAFSRDAEFMTRVQKELYLIEAENTKDLVTKLCDKEIPVLLVHGQYTAGSYPLAIAKATRQDLESCQSLCSRQATDKKTLSSSRNIDVLEEQKSIDRHSYLKFVCLIQDIAKNVLVGVLKGRLPGANFGNSLNGMKTRLLSFLNSNQEQLVYPDGLTYTGDLTDMDVSLLCIILRNHGTICQHQNGWGKEPEVHDHSISANIDRIRMAKNMIVSHSQKCSLEYAEFNNQWETIRRCCIELGGEQYGEDIDTLLTSTFDSNIEQQLSEKLENLKETDMDIERHCKKLEELLDSATKLLVNLQKEPAFRGRTNGTQYEEGTTPMILQIKGNSLPCKTEIEEKIGNYNNNDMHVTAVENGSIVIRLHMFSSAFQSFGYVLAVIDKLLRLAFPTMSVSKDDIPVSIIFSVDMHQFSEANEGHLTVEHSLGKNAATETFMSETSKHENTTGKRQTTNENRRSKEERNDLQEDVEDTWFAPRHSTVKRNPEEQIKNLRIIFESVEDLMNSPDFEDDLKDELSEACPNYLTVFLTAKRDLLRNDCGIVVAGETSAGKSTLINLLIGQKVLKTGNLPTTGKITRIRDSETMKIQSYSKNETLQKEVEVPNVKKLRKIIADLTVISRPSFIVSDLYVVDAYLPVPILKGNVIIVDTPGIGENYDLDNIILDFLPHAVSFVFIVNAKETGGMHENKLLKILKTIMDNREKMPCFDPREVMILTNQWDAIKNDGPDSDEDDDSNYKKEDQHTQTFNLIKEKFEKAWCSLDEENVYRVSLLQVEEGIENLFTAEYKRFETALKTTIEKNVNKRIEFYYRFLKAFIQNAQRGTLARLNTFERSEEEQREIIFQSRTKIKNLQTQCEQSKETMVKQKTKIILSLTEKLHDFLISADGKKEILNPHGTTPISEISFLFLEQEVQSRFKNGIHKWFTGKEAASIIKPAEDYLRSEIKVVESKLHEIEISMIGKEETGDFTAAHGALLALAIITFPITLVLAVAICVVFLPISVPFLIWGHYSGFDYRQYMIDLTYKSCLSTVSLPLLKEKFEESFGVEYDKMIDHIFGNHFPNLIRSMIMTNEKLLEKHQSIKENRDLFVNLGQKVRLIQEATESFEMIMDFD